MRKLGTTFDEKIWGSTELEPWYPAQSANIGEVWFETVPELPLLVKFIFTSERLSIQVHPGDAEAQRAGEPRGKTEMWYVLRAAPGATLGIGLKERISRERLREVCLSGEIEQLTDWKPVLPGDVVFVPAGTIHAIGGGLALCEIQQHSDITYRLYDYGRPRELHLEQGVAVSDPEPYAANPEPRASAPGVRRLVECPYFTTDEVEIDGAFEYVPVPERPQILIALRGEGLLGSSPYRQGEAWLIEAGSQPFIMSAKGQARLLRTFVP
jgi:mannose-6-phosphate isomerase